MTPGNPNIRINRPLHARIRRLVREHGTDYVYERDTNIASFALLLACTCPGGHGVSHLPWRGWVATTEAQMDVLSADSRAAEGTTGNRAQDTASAA